MASLVPKGFVPLKPDAIRLFAQARGISLGSARVEIRAELHSGAILAYALEQSTGQMLQIIPELWGTDHGSRWLKSGKCWLPDEDGVRITRKRFGISFSPPEIAPIFIVEADLHRPSGDYRPQARPNQSSGAQSSPASTFQSGQDVLRQSVREMYMRLWPDGFKGRAKERDQAIQRDFERQGKKPPTVRTIQRALKG